MVTYIYTLSDPRTNEVKYVGKTINPRNRRLAHEFRIKGKSNKEIWNKELRSLGLKYIFEIVDCVPSSDWRFWEKFYIQLFKVWGFILLNHNEGGTGSDIVRQETREKLRIRMINRKRLFCSIYKVAIKKRGTKWTKEQSDRVKKSRKLLNLKMSKNTLIKRSITNSIPVYMFDKQWNFIMEHSSLGSIKKYFNTNDNSLVGHLKRQKNRKSWRGYKFQYKHEFEQNKREGSCPL